MGSDDSNGDLSVALDTLATGGGMMPAVGDDVDVQVTGKVSRIDESKNCAYVTPTTLNGEPPPDMGDEPSPGDKLQQQAQQADQESDY